MAIRQLCLVTCTLATNLLAFVVCRFAIAFRSQLWNEISGKIKWRYTVFLLPRLCVSTYLISRNKVRLIYSLWSIWLSWALKCGRVKLLIHCFLIALFSPFGDCEDFLLKKKTLWLNWFVKVQISSTITLGSLFRGIEFPSRLESDVYYA